MANTDEQPRPEFVGELTSEDYMDFFECSLEAMVICVHDGTVVRGNQAWFRMLGYPSESEAIGPVSIADICANPKDFDDFLHRVETYGVVTDSVRLRKHDGTVIHCERSSVARKDASGRIDHLFCIFRDISAHLHSERTLRASEQRYRSAFEHSTEALYIASSDGIIVEANGRWLEIFGYAPNDLPGMHISDMYAAPHDWNPHGYKTSESTIARDDVRLRKKDGTVFFGQHTLVAATDAGGNPIGYQGLVRDTTELRLARVLERQERMFGERLMETSPACVLVFNAEGIVIFANHETERVLGIERELIIGTMPERQIDWVDAQGNGLSADEIPIATVLRHGHPIYGVECAANLPPGMRTLSISAAPLFGDDDEVTCVVTTVEDITERKLAEQSLRASLSERATLLRELYHRVKNNLAAIIGLTEMRRRATNDPQVSAALAELAGQVRSMAVAHELLYQSKSLSPISMDDYFGKLLGQLPNVYGDRVRANVSIDASGVALNMDYAVPLGMIVNELAMNTLRHAFPGGKTLDGTDDCRFSVSLRRDADIYILDVRDNGCGIPPGFDWRNAPSMGLHLIRMLGEHQLQGTLDMDGTYGTHFRLSFSVSENDRS